jgi:acyl carrier protein
MEMGLEETVRRVVATQLGVTPETLAPEVSLTDDLAADSLDLIELTLSLEEELALTFSPDTIEDVRTYGELVSAVIGAARSRPLAEGTRLLRACVVGSSGRLVRADSVTPYTLEEIAEDARRAGRGARLEIDLEAPDDTACCVLALRFAWLETHGVAVTVRRAGRPGRAPAAA